MSGNSYEQAYSQAKKENDDALDRYKKASQDKTLPNTELDRYKQELADASKRMADIARQYRTYNDKQVPPESTGEDKVGEAIYKDMQKIFENRKKLDQEFHSRISFDTSDNANNTESNDTNPSIFSSVGNMIDGLKNTISGMVSNTIDGIAKTADRLSELASDASNKISSLFSSDSSKNAQTQALAGHSADKGQKETQTKVDQISPDSHGAIKNPPACVTKPITEVTVNTKSAPVEQKKEELPKDGPLSKVGDKIKELTGHTATMTDAVKSVTNEISDNVKKATGAIAEIKASAQSVIDEGKKAVSTVKESIDGVVDTAAGVVRDVTSSITSVTTPIMSTITETIDAGKSLTDKLTSSLPGPLGQFVKAKSDNFFNNTVNTIANNKIVKFQNTLTSLSSLGKSRDLTNAIGTTLLAHVNKKYPTVTDTSGLDLSHIFGRNTDKSKIDSYYEQLAKLSPKSTNNRSTLNYSNNKTDKSKIGSYHEQLAKLSPELTNNLSTLNYSDNKILFDTLLALLTQDGAAGLLEQLLSCTASDSLYFDSSSVKVLQESAKEVTKSGDVESYKTILDKLGKSNLPNVKQDLITINANNDRDNAVLNAITFDLICAAINIEGKDLLVCDNSIKPSGTVYDANAVRLFTVNNTYTADKYISSDIRKLLQAAIYKNK